VFVEEQNVVVSINPLQVPVFIFVLLISMLLTGQWRIFVSQE